MATIGVSGRKKKFFSNLFFPIFAQQISTIFEEHIKHFNLMKINSISNTINH